MKGTEGKVDQQIGYFFRRNITTLDGENGQLLDQETFLLIAFVLCVTVTLVAFTALMFRISADLFIRRKKPSISKSEIVIGASGILGILCIFYGLLIEPYWLSIERVSLKSSKIKANQQITVIQISDLHCDPKLRLENKLPEVVGALKPDAIVFTGDAINSPGGLQNFRSCLTRLAKIAPTFVVKGNWDSFYFTDLDRFGGTGATELNDKAVKLRIKENDVWIGGLPVGSKNSVETAMREVPLGDYRIFLFHYPDFIEQMQASKIDLYLAGHTHGGQVALPIYGALVTLSSRGKQFESGLHKLGDTYEYTNRGIGMEGGMAPRVRFCARPEVTVFEISGESKSSFKL